jgi:hypothetical protein
VKGTREKREIQWANAEEREWKKREEKRDDIAKGKG